MNVSPVISSGETSLQIINETLPESPESAPKFGHANLAFEPDDKKPNFEEFRARPQTRDGGRLAQDSTVVKDIRSDDEEGLEHKTIKF